MSIPTWSYSKEYYDNLTDSEAVYIKTDVVKGKGLFSRKAFDVGEVLLMETGLCCTQNVDEAMRNVPCCMHCLVSLETPKQIVSRCTKNKKLASELPCPNVHKQREVVPCKFQNSGCSAMFCSARCQMEAWKGYHFSCCRGRMSPEAQAAYDAFATNSWEQGGIDYSDTHFFALRFLSIALTRHRLHMMDMKSSYAAIAQLIKARIEKFHFSFLLTDDDEEKDGEKKPNKETGIERYQRFVKYKSDLGQDPAVVKASEKYSKEDMLNQGMAFLKKIFQFRADEAEFITTDMWSELLGAVLLNGQERTPNSPYTEYTELMEEIPEGKEKLRLFRRAAKEAHVDLNKCHTSSKGQGIYTVGACFNHSCNPNLQIQYTTQNDETIAALVIRPIKADEECTISYINENLPFIERHQQLFEHYLFDCTCEKCLEDIEKMKQEASKAEAE